MADGCFDPLHYGHIRYLRAALLIGGSPLIVRVAPDREIVAKGRTPFQTHDERMRTIEALDMVSRVVGYDSLVQAIYEIKPHALVKGSGWRGKLPEDVLRACQRVNAWVLHTDTQERTSRERLSA